MLHSSVGNRKRKSLYKRDWCYFMVMKCGSHSQVEVWKCGVVCTTSLLMLQIIYFICDIKFWQVGRLKQQGVLPLRVLLVWQCVCHGMWSEGKQKAHFTSPNPQSSPTSNKTNCHQHTPWQRPFFILLWTLKNHSIQY